MNTILCYVKLPYPHTQNSLPDVGLIRFEVTLQSSYKRKHPGNGEYREGYIHDLFDHLGKWFDDGKRFRIITNYAKVLIQHSDLSNHIHSKDLILSDVSGKWVNRDNGEVQEVQSIIACIDENPIILCMYRDYSQSSIAVLDIGNYGVIWEENVTRVDTGDNGIMDEELFKCAIAGDYQGSGLSVLCTLYNHYAKICRDNKFGDPSYTYASQGNGAYYATAKPAEIRQTTNKDALSIEIQAHYGGVRMPFGYGHYKGECAMYDISAFYPSIARTALLPVELHFSEGPIREEKLETYLEKYYCIAKVDLRSPNGWYPLRGKFTTSYPAEDFTAYLHHCELQRAIALKQIDKIHYVCVYGKSSILSNAMDNLLSARMDCIRKNDKLGETYCKAIAVGWLGKLGSKLSCWEDVNNVIPVESNGEWDSVSFPACAKSKFRSIDGRVQRKRDDLVPYLGSIAIAGAITAYGRELLWSYLNYVGRENVLYTDTDGFICCGAGMRKANALAIRAGFSPGILRRIVTADCCTIASIGCYEIGARHGQQGYSKDIEGGYDPATTPLKGSFAAVMHKASKVTFSFFGKGICNVQPWQKTCV